MLFLQIVCIALLLTVVHSCQEAMNCDAKMKHCATSKKFRAMCPCTCAPHINFINCCANQEFEREECRDLCTYNVAQADRLFAKNLFRCFNDGFKMQYCATNGYQNSTDCCLQHGVSQDKPGEAGCSRFCEGNTPPCSRLFDYNHCTRGAQLANAVECAIKEYDKPRWKRNAVIHMCQ